MQATRRILAISYRRASRLPVEILQKEGGDKDQADPRNFFSYRSTAVIVEQRLNNGQE
jgi:hypothetical protein